VADFSCFAHDYVLKRFSPTNPRGALSMSDVLSIPAVPNFTTLPFESRFNQALIDMRRGHPIVLVDDFDRENEADLIVAAERISVPTMAMLIRECSGIVCLCFTDEVAGRLDLPMMVTHNESRFQTAFTVTIDAREGITTGVSAQDRVATIRAAIAEHARPQDIVRPGHVFPLRSVRNGVLGRGGHTEGSVDLAMMAGLRPAAVLCEPTNPDGTMAKGEQVRQFADRHHMAVLSIEELVGQRLRSRCTSGQCEAESTDGFRPPRR
jgi:3,4-dihydroxy 2-butanone 4-phosphate synthase